MRVDFGLFEGDTLLERGAFRVSHEAQCTHFKSFHAAHWLCEDSAKIVLSSFSSNVSLTTVDLDMPIQQSEDWESIELLGYTLAFRCSLDA